MSAKATFWAWQQKGVGASAKLVLMCLADCHNADTGRCDPGAKYISEHTELNIKTIPSAIKKLENAGILTVEKRPGKTPNYALHITQNWDTPKTGTPEIGYTQKRGNTPPEIGVTPPPKLGDEPKKNLKRTYKNISMEILGDAIELETAKEFIDHRIKLKKPLTQGAFDRTMKKAIQASADKSLCQTADEIIHHVIDSGWQSFQVSWLKNKQTAEQPTGEYKPVPFPSAVN